MANIQKLTYPYFTDGSTQLNAQNLNPIISKMNEMIEAINSGVTPTPTTTILSSYYSANNTISASEKSALETLVQGLIDNNLWSKFKYFYPMCGTSVADQLIEVVNPSTDDILGNTDTTNLSVSSRKLEVAMTTNANKKGDKVLGSRVQTLDLNDISYISAFNYKDDTGAFTVFNQYYNYNGEQSANAIGLTETYGGNKCARISGIATTTIASTDTETVSIGAERIVMGRQIDTDLSVFHDTTKFKSATLQTGTTCVPFGKAKALLEYASANGGENAVEMGLYAITTGLTDAQWGTVHGLVKTFLASIGKHTA